MIHPTAQVESGAEIGVGTRVWHHCHIRTQARIGENCNLGDNVYVDCGAVIGNNVKLQNRVSVYRGVTLEDGVFVGPHSTFTNDKYPRAVLPDGSPVSEDDWSLASTLVKFGASIGAGCVILPGVTIGRWAMVAAGSLVTRDVPDHGLVIGNPARLVGYACRRGHQLTLDMRDGSWFCLQCNERLALEPLPVDEDA